MNQCKVFNSLRLFICKWPGRDTSREITWQAWPGHTTRTHISHTHKQTHTSWEAGFVSDDRLSCISCGQSIDNLTSLSLRLARTNVSLGLLVSRLWSERHKVSVALSGYWHILFMTSPSRVEWETERKLEKIFSLCKFNGCRSQNFMSARGFFPSDHTLFFFSFPMLRHSPSLSLFLSVFLPLPLYVSLTANCNEI